MTQFINWLLDSNMSTKYSNRRNINQNLNDVLMSNCSNCKYVVSTALCKVTSNTAEIAKKLQYAHIPSMATVIDGVLFKQQLNCWF
jgi:hypothetical protein